MRELFFISETYLRQLYIADNHTVTEIAKQLNTSAATINRFLRKYNIKKDMMLRNAKIAQTINNRTDAEKQEYSAKISAARTGKGIGVEPWNKGKHVGNRWAGKHHSEETKQKISNTRLNKSPEDKQATSQKLSKALKGRKPWNAGLTYTMDPEVIRQAKEKEIATKKLKGTFLKSNLEELFYQRLLLLFTEDAVVRQYFDKERYPFSCDFYIKPLDLFIELNGNWTHGFRPFDANDNYCIEQLAAWEAKAKTSDYYKNAIYTWTNLDVRKQAIAKANGLLYVALYCEEEINELLKILEEE